MILIKGAGDLASAIALRLVRAGYKVVMTDIEKPTTVRRTVSFSRAVYENEAIVEDVKAVLVNSEDEVASILEGGNIAIMVDADCSKVMKLKPEIIIDAILAKKNIGTKITDAELVIGVGPGFTPSKDCHVAIETQRGHYLGRVLIDRCPIENTGVPGIIGGYGRERIIRATDNGEFYGKVKIGDIVKAGDEVAIIKTEKGDIPILALIDGVVRGLLQDGLTVHRGMKSGDIDPRCEPEHCNTVSDKGSAIAGGVLEAICGYEKGVKRW